jgi:hypothetical protein
VRCLLLLGRVGDEEADDTEVVLGGGEILLGRAREPVFGLAVVDRDAAPVEVEHAEVVLCCRMTLFGRESIPEGRLVGILGHALALIMEEADQILGCGIARLGAREPGRIGRGEVAALVGGLACVRATCARGQQKNEQPQATQQQVSSDAAHAGLFDAAESRS